MCNSQFIFYISTIICNLHFRHTSVILAPRFLSRYNGNVHNACYFYFFYIGFFAFSRLSEMCSHSYFKRSTSTQRARLKTESVIRGKQQAFTTIQNYRGASFFSRGRPGDRYSRRFGHKDGHCLCT